MDSLTFEEQAVAEPNEALTNVRIRSRAPVARWWLAVPILLGCSPGEGSSSATDAGWVGDADVAHALELDASVRSSRPHAELCPGATPGVGKPAPAGKARPVRQHPLYEYLESPVATADDFGVRTSVLIERIENQPEPTVHHLFSGSSGGAYVADGAVNWPEWLRYGFEDQTHEIEINANTLTRGTYHLTIPLWYHSTSLGVSLDTHATLEVIMRVRGIGFTSDRLSVPQYVGDSPGSSQRITLAGGNVRWRITDVPPWLRASQREGATLDRLELEFWREPVLAQSSPGTYEGRLCVENERGDADSVPVFAVVERPRLRPLHSQRYLYKFPSSQQLSSFTYIFTDLRDQVTWQATSSAPWLKLPRASGATNERLDFIVDPAGLPDGRHRAELMFSDPSGRNDAVSVPVYYIQDQRLSPWTFKSRQHQDAVSPISPHGLQIRSDRVSVQDLFSGEISVVSGGPGQVRAATVSPHTSRLYVLSIANGSTPMQIRSYSWPDLRELEGHNAQAFPDVDTGDVLSVLGREYWALQDTVVNVAEGRSGPILPPPLRNRARLRIYDDAATIFGFWEDLGTAAPDGWVHWAHSPTAICGFLFGKAFECHDHDQPYLTIEAEPDPVTALSSRTPLFTHQGGVYFDYTANSYDDLAFSATGQLIPQVRRTPITDFGRQWGDTLLIGDGGGSALNYLFEPGPPGVEQPAPARGRETCPAPAGQVIESHELGAVALVADTVRDRVYALVGGNGLYAGELVTFESSSGALLNHVSLGGKPLLADIAPDGSSLWVVLSEPDRLRAIDLTGAAPVPGTETRLATDWEGRRLWASDVAVGTGTKDTVVVALPEESSGAAALYTEGVLRNMSPVLVRYLAPGPFGFFFGSANADANNKTWLFRVEGAHLNPVAEVANGTFDLTYREGFLLGQVEGGGALVLDVRDPQRPSQVATFPIAAAFLLDPPSQRVWALSVASEEHAAQLVGYDLNTSTVSVTSWIDGVDRGYPKDFVRTASGCFAYISSAQNIVFFSPPG